MRPPLQAVLAAWVLSGGATFAQMGYTAPSLEWLVADAQAVVRASVAKVERAPVVHPNDGMYRNPEVRKTLTLRVHETLKGDPAVTRTVVLQTLDSDRIEEGWQEAGREQLWFLRGRTRQGLIRLGPPVAAEKGFSSLPPPILTMDLTVLEKPDDILKAARAAVAAEGKPRTVPSHDIELPRAVMQRSGRSGDANRLVVPADPRLEALAHRLIASPGDFLAKDERLFADRLRLEGVKALRPFRTDKNADRLKSLLQDPAWSIHTSPDGAREKVYDIREAAYETLRSWDIPAGKPVLREPAGDR